MMADRWPLHWMVVAHHRPLHQRAVKTIREGTRVTISAPSIPTRWFYDLWDDVMYYFATGQLGQSDLESRCISNFPETWASAVAPRPDFLGTWTVSGSFREILTRTILSFTPPSCVRQSPGSPLTGTQKKGGEFFSSAAPFATRSRGP